MATDKKPKRSATNSKPATKSGKAKPVTKTAAKPAKVSSAKSVKPAKAETKTAQPEAAAEPTKEAPKTSRWQRAFRAAGRFIARTSLPEIFMISSLAMARYLKNSDFSYPSEIVLDVVLFAVIVTIVYFVFRLVLRRRLPAHIAALLLSYALYFDPASFKTLHKWADKLIPHSATTFTHAMLAVLFLAIVFGLLGFVADWLLRRFTKPEIPAMLLKIGVFVICFTFAWQLVKVGGRMWTIRHDLAYKQPALSLQQDKSKIKSKPDVYYLLFDRYANATTLKNDYNYDNSGLLNTLSKDGFVTRDNAYANYPFTQQSVSSTLNMNYLTSIGKEFKNDSKDYQTAFPLRTLFDNPPVAQALKANGYNYNQVSSWWDFSRKIPAANDEPTESFRLRIFGKTFWLSDLQRDLVNKSILSPLLKKGLSFGSTAVVKYDKDRNPQENFDAQMNALKTIAENSSSEKQPQFTFAHVLSPHDPYIFDANCNTPTYDQNRTDNGVDETIKYTNQVTCINKSIESVIGTIRAKDPNAVVILQADEGPYPKQFRGTLTPGHYYDPINLPLKNMRQKFGVLASYYLPGVSATAKTSPIDSSVNAFRYVLDHYLGYEMPLLPDCHFAAGDKYELYNFQQVTGLLEGTKNPPACAQYQ